MSIEIISEKKTQIGQVAVTFTVGRIVSQAKATKGKAGMAVDTVHVRGSTAGTGLRVGAADAVQSATSEIMDVTGRRDAHSNSELSARRTIDATDVLWGAGTPWTRKENRKRSANVPAVETPANMGVTAGETAPNFPVCCYCDSVLSCAQCGREQPAVADTRRTEGAGSSPPEIFSDQQAPS